MSTIVPSPSPFLAAIKSRLVDINGQATWIFERLLQDWDTRLTNGLNAIGEFVGEINPITIITGRVAIGTLFGNIDNTGIVTAAGIDFARAYVNKNTDHIADGTGSPLAGGSLAYAALVVSGPTTGQILVFNGTDWLPHAKANTKAHAVNEWLDSYDDTTGNFTASQPAFSNLSGQIDPATQEPDSGVVAGSYTASSVTVDAKGRVTAASGGAGISVTITTAPLTGAGTPGSMTFVNGILTAQTPAT